MVSILQLSDFHIKTTMPEPQDNEKITSFIDFIKELNITRPILLYNGDVIDSKSIGKSIPDDATDDQKAELWESMAKKSFELAQRYFSYIMEELDIPNDRIIICCGNHDINLYSNSGETFHCPSDDIEKVEYGSQRFRLINDFINSLVLRQGTYNTHLRKIDGINFLVANSQWVDKGTKKLCIHCDSINEVISDHEKTLNDTKQHCSKQHNIFVAHSPRGDYCEYALYEYQENKYSAVANSIDTYFGLNLFGDKHSDSKHNFDYIAGAPLDEERITYGLHQFTDKHQYLHRSLIYQNGTWKTNRSIENIETILNLSIKSLKSRALKYLFNSESLDTVIKSVLAFEKIRSENNWRQLDKLFRSYISLQESRTGRPGDPIPVADDMINTVSGLMAGTEKQISLVARGRTRTGKSIFMTVLYLNLLYRFYCGTVPCLPVYINLEAIERRIRLESKDIGKHRNAVLDAVKQTLNAACKAAQKYNCKICCILDGLKQQVFSDKKAIEEEIRSIINRLSKTLFQNYIYCIDTDDDLNFAHTSFATERNAHYLIYFDNVTSMNVNSSQKYEDFISAFLTLNGNADNSVQILKKNISRMQVQEIDLNTLSELGNDLIQESNETFFSVLDKYAERKLAGYDIELAATICFQLYYLDQNYSKLRKNGFRFSADFELLEIIRTQKLIVKYLLAVHYVKSMLIQKEGQKIPDNSPLNQLYGHEICSFIRGYILKNHYNNDVQQFERSSYKGLNYAGKSTLTYIIGRLNSDPSSLIEIFKSERSKLGRKPVANSSERSLYEFYVAKRSIYVSETTIFWNLKSNNDNYLQKLLSDGLERKINREFYLQFYGDRISSQIKLKEEVILCGFDIYKTYHMLASRLKHWTSCHEDYPLLKVELFTLCDLIQTRIDHQFITAKAERKTLKMVGPECNIRSFFYNKKYNIPKKETASNVLKFLVKTIEEYIKTHPDQNKKDIFIQYLMQTQNNCSSMLKMINSSSSETLRPEFSPIKLLSELAELEKTKKVGWNITEKMEKLSIDQFNSIRTNDTWYESTLDHVYESYLIGLLYLPAISHQTANYKKQDILNMIMIHDLGESYIGDFPPFCENYEKTREEENQWCQKIFLSGLHNGIADMTEYLQLWNEWNDPYTENINIRIAKEIDKIQMIYKLFVLITQEGVYFTDERVKDFYESISMIRTAEGKQIFNTIIASNNTFVEIARKYGISITPIP